MCQHGTTVRHPAVRERRGKRRPRDSRQALVGQPLSTTVFAERPVALETQGVVAVGAHRN